jgi:pimeloyl-ACP methyl ester carboxylesterase
MEIKSYKTDSVISRDGTTIGFRHVGQGNGVILVHGSMMASQYLMKLAVLLSNDFTVYIPDRRGRGLSGPHGDNYNLIKESEDIQAIVDKTGARNIFGLSSGANVALHAAFITAKILKVSLYEPPISDASSTSYLRDREFVNDINKLIVQGKYGKVLVKLMKASGDSVVIDIIPRFILELIMTFAINVQEKQIKGDDVPIVKLIPTIQFDSKLEIETERQLESYKALKSQVLLLGGSKSDADVKTALNRLSLVLPNVSRINLSGLGHSAPANYGKPEIIARELQLFFRGLNEGKK